jgi:hypothetical protein
MRGDIETGSDLLASREVRRHALASMGRSLATSVAILSGYFLLPFTSGLTADRVLVLLLALLGVGLLLAWQIRAIVRSPFPGARAVGALVVSVPLFLVIFALTYFLMGRAAPEAFSEPLTRLDAAYFTVTIFATVGFGDITPVSQAARSVAMLQMFGDLVLVGLIARVVVDAVQRGRRSRRPGAVA